MDTAFGHHFLRWIWARKGNVFDVKSVVKGGDYGQPVALVVDNGGAFFGLEYPTSENSLESPDKGRPGSRAARSMVSLSKRVAAERVGR